MSTGWREPISTGSLVEIQAQVAGTDLERLIVVGGDLEYLQNLPSDRLLTHAEIRLAAGVLRRLLVDGELHAVWRIIGAHEVTKLVVSATDIDTALAAWPIGWIQYAWAGGASASGAHHAGVVFGVVPKEEHGGLFKSVDQVISGIYLITAWHWSACPQRQRPFPMISMRYPDQNRPHQGKTVALLSYYRPDAHADAGTRLPRPRNAIRALE